MNPPIGEYNSAVMDLAGIGVMVLCSLAVSVFFGLIGALIGYMRNRKAMGLFLGIVFGPLGWLATLFLATGEDDEGIFNGLFAYAAAMAVSTGINIMAWKTVIRPNIDRAIAAVHEERRLSEERDQQRIAALEREEKLLQAERAERDAAPPPALPELSAPATPAPATPAPKPTPPPKPTPIPITPIPRPDPAKMRAEIERKYGSPPGNRP